MLDQNTMIIGAAILILVLVVVLLPGKCSTCAENFKASQNGSMTVNRPKYMPSLATNSSGDAPLQDAYRMQREGFIVPLPTQAQTMKTSVMNGGTIGSTSNPWLGGMQGEAAYGTSVPGMNTATLVSGNGAGHAGSTNVWKTVI